MQRNLKLKKDTLTFQDEEIFNNVDRLKFWVENNPESTFLDKAKIGELRN